MLKTLTLLIFIPFALQAQDDLKIKTGSFDYEAYGKTYEYEGEYVVSKESGSKEKLPHGKGKLTQPEKLGKAIMDGDASSVEKFTKKNYSDEPYLYDGEWHMGEKHGVGEEKKFILEKGKPVIQEHYNGGYENGLFNGKGTLKTLDFEYTGDFKAGKKHGEGTIQMVNFSSPPTAQRLNLVKVKEKYEGNWNEDMFHGKGTFTSFEKKESFTGEFENQAFKKGLYTYKDSNTYDGEWKEGFPSGKGSYTWKSSGDVYVGEFVAGEPKGKGKLTKKDGSYFEGDFKNGNCTGKAKIPYYKIVKINDSKPKLSGFYEGEVNNSIPHGKGTFKVIEGTSEFEMHYTGDWFEGKRQGKGNCKMYQNILIDGKWSRDAQAYYETYEGDWSNDDYHGHGEWALDYFGHASEYVGDFLEGVFHGKGTLTEYTMADPEIYIGRFRNGSFLDGHFVYIDEEDNEITEAKLGNDYIGEWIYDLSQKNLCGNSLFFEIGYDDDNEMWIGYSTEWWGSNISITSKDDFFILNFTHHGELGESPNVEAVLIMKDNNLYLSLTGKKEDFDKLYKCN